MSQSMYSYPAMTANVGDMAGYTGTTQSLGADIASERTAPSRACQGDLGMSHQDWQAQWNQAMEALARAYRRCRRALRQIGVLERPVGDSSDCGTIRVGSFRGRGGGPPPPPAAGAERLVIVTSEGKDGVVAHFVED
ncbi:WXG100 family type VII secretion target, partial [Mycobacterium tuberculosis]|uniref:WXG100 family type VII secretion target n=1 Tax=Mycobacterium tuberculosis TaxID=1773 RepID=UPI003C6DCA2D